MEDDAGVRKRKRDGEAAAAAATGKVDDGDEEEEEGYEGITEESVAEVMRWLELEIKLAVTSPPPQPPPPAEEAYVTVRGSEESCGPSYSGSASTVMASVDVRSGAPAPPAVPWPFPATATAAAAEGEVWEQVDEEWVAQVLTSGPALEGL